MLDVQLLLRQADATAAALARRGLGPHAVDDLLAKCRARRDAQQAKEALAQEQNAASAAIQSALRAGERDAIERAKGSLKAGKARLQAAEAAFAEADAACRARLLEVPNLPAADVPGGATEADNRELRRVGEPRADAPTLAHDVLGEANGWLDFERASKVSGPRFAYLQGAAAALERALANFMLDRARAAGFVEVSPPLLVRAEAMQASGQFPKFKGESFETQDQSHVLIPTSEVPLVAMLSREIVASEALPVRFTALTPCFRREAGAAGRDTRGLVRQHQFYKVELVSLTTAEDSDREHRAMCRHAESLLEALGLPYRTMHLCTGDMGFAAQSTFDLEVWMPSQGCFREISSVSNCGDFQARRAQIRHREGGAGGDARHRPQLLHTLNGSALAVGRTLVAILENYQGDGGRVAVPPVLQPYLGGQTELAPRR